MRNTSGLARIPLLVAVLMVAAGGAIFRVSPPESDEEIGATIVAATSTAAQPAEETEAVFLGEMVVSASRIRD